MALFESAADYASVGGYGFAAATFYAILRGSLVPKKTLDALLGREKQYASDATDQRDDYKRSLETALATIRVQADQVDTLVDANRTAAAIIQALPRGAGSA